MTDSEFAPPPAPPPTRSEVLQRWAFWIVLALALVAASIWKYAG